MTSLSPAQQLRLDLYRDRLAVDPATALDGAIAAYNWIVGQEPRLVQIAEADPALLALLKTPQAKNGGTLVPGEDARSQDGNASGRRRGALKNATLDGFRSACAEGLEAREIEERFGWPRNGAHSRAGRLGLTALWRAARARRRAERQAEPEPEPEPAPVQEEAPAPQEKPTSFDEFNKRKRRLPVQADPDWLEKADAATIKSLLDEGQTFIQIAETLHAPSWRALRDRAGELGLLARTAGGGWTRPASPYAVSQPNDQHDQPKRRKCLRCGTHFLSTGPGNRLCGTCRDAVSGEYDPWGSK